MTRWRRQHVITLQYLAMGICLGILVSFLAAGGRSVTPEGAPTKSRGGAFRKSRQEFVLNKGYAGDTYADVENSVETVTVLCYVVLPASDVPAKRQVYMQTWGKRCSRLLLFSDKAADEKTILVNSTLSTHIEEDAKASLDALYYLHQHFVEHAQWFLRLHPMTYVVLENLRYFLRNEDSSKPLYFGQQVLGRDSLVPFGFAGYVLSKQSLKVFGGGGSKDPMCRLRQLPESILIGECFHSLGIEFGDSRDVEGRSRFHGISVESIAVHDYQSWFHDLDPYDNITRQGVGSVSSYAITFCPISDAVILSMEYFIYTARVYGKLHKSIEINRQPKRLAKQDFLKMN